MAFPLASRIVMVTPAVSIPFALVGVVALMVEVKSEAGPGLKVTLEPVLTTGLAMESVLTSAFVEARVHVDIPLAFVALQVPAVLFVPLDVKVGTIPTTALLAESLSVIVTVDVATPSATTGPVPVMLEFAATAAPDWKTTVPSDFVTGVTIERVLVSAVVDARVQVETPAVVLEEHVP
jgi:hypothetical protein